MSETAKKGTAKSDKSAGGQKAESFSDIEKAAMKERAKELKAEARANKNKAEGETDLLAKIAEQGERALSAEESRFLKRMSAKFRNKSKQ